MDRAAKYEYLEPQIFCSGQHIGYVNTLSVDNVDHQLLLCGGADSAITVWDLEADPDTVNPGDPWLNRNHHSEPLARIERKTVHKFGLSKVAWWPFDNAMFLSGSFDGTVKVWDSEALDAVYDFNMEHKVYAFDVNPIEEDGLLAVGLNHPLIRLIDLRAAGSAQNLKGHDSGSVCSIKWSPTREYMLASGGSDGLVRIWDIRQASQQVAAMDLARTNVNQPLTPLQFRKSHRAVCNGLAWHPSGDELLSVGLDNKARVWDLTGEPGGGINKAINFGPLFQDRRQLTMDPALSFEDELDDDDSLYVFLPSDTGDILMSEYDDGKLAHRLVPPGREVRINRQGCVVARGPGKYELLSGACDGSVILWRNHDDDDDEGTNYTDDQVNDNKRGTQSDELHIGGCETSSRRRAASSSVRIKSEEEDCGNVNTSNDNTNDASSNEERVVKTETT